MYEDKLDKSNFLNIYQQWSNLINNSELDQNGGIILSNKNKRFYNPDTLRKMMLNSTYGNSIGMNTSIIGPASSTRFYDRDLRQAYGRGLRPEFVVLDNVEVDTELPELSDLNQEISISFKLSKNLLIDKPEKLKINFDEDKI